ncbi:hypothetical protein HEP73_03775 [Xanthomonas sp. GW]|nr:hypothetical protein HEP73_03775 [Xanthomonas sp. GW]
MAAIALLAPALATAQSLNPAPSSPTATRQSTALESAPVPKAAPVRSSLDDRPESSQSSAHKPTKAKPASANGVNAATDRQPVKLYDRGGRVIPGAVQVGPNRVLDTRSGRYYSTVPSGDGQRINE